MQKQTPRSGMWAWALYDWAHSAFGTIIQTFIFAAYFTAMVAQNPDQGTLYWGNAIGIAGIVIALMAPFLGAVADQKARLKPWVASFTLLCALATAALWFIQPEESYMLSAVLLVALGTLASQFALTFYNAMLPGLVPQERQGLWSGWGWALGYVGGLACLGLLWFALLGPNPWLSLNEETGEHVRVACLFTAVWLIVFSLPMLWLTPDAEATKIPFRKALGRGLAQLRDSLAHIREYKDLVRFLIAHMLYIDALAAIFAMGGVFAAGAFGMNTQQILLFGITLNVTAGVGAAVFAWIDHYLGSKRTILVSLTGLILACIALLTVQEVKHFWIAGAVLGLFVGPIQASSRAYMSKTVPEHLRAQMFGLFTLSGKATSFLGPLLVGWITHLSGSQRIGMSSLIVLLVLGMLILLTVPKVGESR